MTIFRTFKLRRARAAREKADRALQRAVWARDTRAIHEARQRMRDCTHRVMRLEVMG